MKTASRLLRASLLAIALSSMGACGDGDLKPNAARLVAIHVVAAAIDRSETNYSGEIRPRHETALAFRASGKLATRLVDIGQTVTPGQALARLAPEDLELNADAARAALSAAESELAFSKAEYERFRSLRERNFVSEAALEAKEAAWQAARGKAQSARAQAELARNQRSYATLAADGAGVVAAVLAEPGQVVAAGQAVLRLALPGEMEVAISVPESRVADLRASTDVRISLWADNHREYAGRVREIAPMADPVTRTYAVRVSLLKPDPDVRLGMTANVFLGRRVPAPSVLIPATALFQQEGRPAVWVVEADHTLALRPVEVDQFREDGVQVKAGLKQGERIVAAGVHKVVAGEKVRFTP